MDRRVLPLVRPSSRNLPLVTRMIRIALNLKSSRPRPLRPAAPFRQPEFWGGAGASSIRALKSRILLSSVSYWRDSAGSSSRALLQEASAPEMSPRRSASSASAANCFNSFAWTRRAHEGQASIPGGMSAPHSGQRVTGGLSIRRFLRGPAVSQPERPGHFDDDARIQFPRFPKRNPEEEERERILFPDQERHPRINQREHPEGPDAAGRVRPRDFSARLRRFLRPGIAGLLDRLLNARRGLALRHFGDDQPHVTGRDAEVGKDQGHHLVPPAAPPLRTPPHGDADQVSHRDRNQPDHPAGRVGDHGPEAAPDQRRQESQQPGLEEPAALRTGTHGLLIAAPTVSADLRGAREIVFRSQGALADRAGRSRRVRGFSAIE